MALAFQHNAHISKMSLHLLTIEHLVHSHPVLFVILSKLFNIIMSAGYVPCGFRLSYTVPLQKVDIVSSTNTVDNYRAISISPILSKIFERCILNKYSKFLNSSKNQFGFKKRIKLWPRNIFRQESCWLLCKWWLNSECMSVRFIESIR